VQHLAGVRARSQQRVIAALTGVAERRALLGAAVDLADERVDVDDQSRVTGARPCLPCTGQRFAEDAVELSDVPEG
jgi:hypothetical protein